MIDLRNIEKIYIYKNKCDLRMGINSLSLLTRELTQDTDIKHTLFIFYGNSRKLIKILELDNDGWWLYIKRLSEAKFTFIKNTNDNKISISKYEFNLFLNGVNIEDYRLHINGNINISY